MIVRAMPPERFPWLAQRAGLTLHPGFGALEAVNERGETVGAVGFDGWWPGAVALHVALDHPAALRHLLRPAFAVAFDAPPRGFNKAAVTATVLSTNKRSLRLVQHLGFRHVHTGRDYAGPGVHIEFFEMRREECRFIPRTMRRAA
jgi:RimJ/RimL family protein N-acetyltransferase